MDTASCDALDHAIGGKSLFMLPSCWTTRCFHFLTFLYRHGEDVHPSLNDDEPSQATEIVGAIKTSCVNS